MQKENLTYLFQSDFEELNRLPDILDEITATFQINSELESKLMLTVSEAVTNAMKHGNKSDSSKKVKMDVNKNDSLLEITVEDEGEGFDPDEVPDPLAEHNLLKASGRGVYLMKEYADDVSFNERGNRLTMKFRM